MRDPTPTPAAVRAQLERVLASPGFAKSGRSCRFLRFVCEEALAGRAGQIKESLIAVEVFGRDPAYDPQTDSVVRVEARAIRNRLREYYAAAGNQNELVIEIPKGGYAPVFRMTPPRASRPLMVAGALALSILAGFLAFREMQRLTERSAPSVVVLPFLTPGAAPEVEYFADGLVDELTTVLAGVRGLRVVSRTSAFQFRGRSGDVREIARRLNAGTVVEGSVREVDGRLRVTVQLINAADGFHIWGTVYDRARKDTLTLPEEAGQAMARALALTPPPAPASGAANAPSGDLEARNHYWCGRWFRNRRTPEDLVRVIESFQAAAARDPRFAAAHAALAEAHSFSAFHRWTDRERGIADARRSAREALALDPSLAEAHAVLGVILYSYDWDWPGAERAFRRAIDLDPSSSRVHQDYALALTTRRRHGEALAESVKAAELDPLLYVNTLDRPVILLTTGRAEEALAEARRVTEVNPASGPAHALCGTALVFLGRPREALPHYEEALKRAPNRSFILGRHASALALAGEGDRARRVLADLERMGFAELFEPVHAAPAYTALGDTGRALDCLELSLARRDADVIFADTEPVYERLRGEPRYQAVRRKLGLP